jgi:haloalkane dehalogenase
MFWNKYLALIVLSILITACSDNAQNNSSWDNVNNDSLLLSSGHYLHYKQMGQGTPIIFIHGNLTHSYLWRKVMPAASKYGNCYAIDLMGMGKSDKPIIDYTIREQSRFVFEFIEALAPKNAILVGHEWGGTIAMYYGSVGAHNLKGYALIEPIISGADSADIAMHPNPFVQASFDLKYAENSAYRIFNENALLTDLLPKAVLKPLTESTTTAYVSPYQEIQHYRPLYTLFESFPVNGKPQSSQTFISTSKGSFFKGEFKKLLIHSNEGIYVSTNGVRILKERTKNLTTINIGDSGLLIPEDQPEATAAAICKWLENEFGLIPQ